MKRLIALMMVLAVAACLVACGGGEEGTKPQTTTTTPAPSTTQTVPTTATTTDTAEYNYRIRVVDQDGNPIVGAFVIFCLEQCNFYQTNEDGWALINAEITDGYQAHIMSLPEGYEGYTFSEEYTNFESGQTEMTLVATKPAE